MSQLNSVLIEERKRGKVKWFNVSKGFGFITCTDIKEDIMVHFSEVRVTIAGTRNLFEGQTVEFDLMKTEGKGYSARDVELKL
jgi:CspA family cold shock protein